MPGFRIETEVELSAALQRLGELSPQVAAQQAEFNELLAEIDAYQSQFLTEHEKICADPKLAADAVQEGRLVDPEIVHGWMKKLNQRTKN